MHSLDPTGNSGLTPTSLPRPELPSPSLGGTYERLGALLWQRRCSLAEVADARARSQKRLLEPLCRTVRGASVRSIASRPASERQSLSFAQQVRRTGAALTSRASRRALALQTLAHRPQRRRLTTPHPTSEPDTTKWEPRWDLEGAAPPHGAQSPAGESVVCEPRQQPAHCLCKFPTLVRRVRRTACMQTDSLANLARASLLSFSATTARYLRTRLC